MCALGHLCLGSREAAAPSLEDVTRRSPRYRTTESSGEELSVVARTGP